MKLDDWAIEQHIVAGDWFAAAVAVAARHGVPPPSPNDLPVSKINVYYRMPKTFIGITMNHRKYTWTRGVGIYSGPSLAQGTWAVIWTTTRSQHEIARLGDS